MVDAEFRPVGVVSIRDLVGGSEATALVSMTTPASTVVQTSSIEVAGAGLAETGRRHLVVVDERGTVTGFISAHDVMCALLGQPVRHPKSFPHYGPATKRGWSDPVPRTPHHALDLPPGPGLIQLIRGGRNLQERAVWISASRDLRADAERFMSHEDALPEHLRAPRARGELRVRVAAMAPQLPAAT